MNPLAVAVFICIWVVFAVALPPLGLVVLIAAPFIIAGRVRIKRQVAADASARRIAIYGYDPRRTS